MFPIFWTDRHRNTVDIDMKRPEKKQTLYYFICDYGHHFNNFSLRKSLFCLKVDPHQPPGLGYHLLYITTLCFQEL